MEPFAAVGFVTSIIQLIGVADSITSTVREIRQSASGLPREAEKFRNLATSICRDIDIIVKPSVNSKIDDAFRNYATDLRRHVQDYLTELDRLKVRSPGTWWQPWRAAIKAWWNSRQMEESMTLIHRMGGQVTMHVVNVYLPAMSLQLDDINAQATQAEKRLAKEMEHLLEAVKEVQGRQKDGIELLKATKQWFADQETMERQRRCLRALYFTEIGDRQADVKSAHQKTFKWILEEAVDETATDKTEHYQQPKLRTWLESTDIKHNIFWISGKPGGGKSTLMKFIATHSDLPKHLENWVGSQKLIIARYFFWNEGIPLQRSIEGLLRSLLYQILGSHRDLIFEAFPGRDWDLGGDKYQFPKDRLEQALMTLLGSTSNHGLKFFFLIDGLDEADDRDQHDEDVPPERELLDLLCNVRQHPDLRLCLSSRAWPSFEKEFGSNNDFWIKIQDLTRHDIRIYIQETLQKDPDFQKLSVEDNEYDLIINELLQKAKGVFLWVYLACRSLLDGITNGDRKCDLQDRLHHLPGELEKIYRHIMEQIMEQAPPIYQKQAARDLLLASTYQAYI